MQFIPTHKLLDMRELCSRSICSLWLLDMQPNGCSIASFLTCIKVAWFLPKKTPSYYFTTLISVILRESVRISKVRCGLV